MSLIVASINQRVVAFKAVAFDKLAMNVLAPAGVRARVTLPILTSERRYCQMLPFRYVKAMFVLNLTDAS